MSRTLNAHLPPRVEQKLVDACLDSRTCRVDAYALAADLIPKGGAGKLQSSAVRKLARDAFGGSRSR